MKKLLVVLFCVVATSVAAQNCPQYSELIRKAKQYWANGDFEKALNQLFAAREHCPSKSAQIDSQFVIFTNDIAKKYKNAKYQAQIAKKATARADSVARRIYANDLAYKSQTALKEGDRNSAYRLAEFAHRYVDDNNLHVTQALVDALYNERVDKASLNWSLDLKGHTNSVNSISFSPDGQRLATGIK